MEGTNVYHITYSKDTRTACLYFYGCNFRCLGCIRRRCNYDIHLAPSKQNQMDSIRERLSIDETLKILKKTRDIEKVILMGGEPTIDPNLTPLTARLKDDLHSCNILLTNGYIFPDIRWIDEVCVGIKAYSSCLHKDYTGFDSKEVFKNLAKFYREDIALRTESVFIPDYIDVEETGCIAKAISEINPYIPHRIDAYIPVPGARWGRPTPAQIEEATKRAKRYLKQVTSLMDGPKAHKIVVLN